MLKPAFGEDTMSRTKTFDWYKSGVTLVNDTECSGSPSLSKLDENVA
jgi:hypothetical protein